MATKFIKFFQYGKRPLLFTIKLLFDHYKPTNFNSRSISLSQCQRQFVTTKEIPRWSFVGVPLGFTFGLLTNVSCEKIPKLDCECGSPCDSPNMNCSPPLKSFCPTTVKCEGKCPDCCLNESKCQCNQQCQNNQKESVCMDDERFSITCPMKWKVEQEALSHEFLVRQANSLTTDAVTRLLGEVLSTIQDYHCKYREYLQMMIDLLHESRACARPNTELIDIKITILRGKMQDLLQSIIEIETYLCSVEELTRLTAKTAFLACAEFPSFALLDRLEAVLCEVKATKIATQQLEKEMIEIQAVICVETGKSLKC